MHLDPHLLQDLVRGVLHRADECLGLPVVAQDQPRTVADLVVGFVQSQAGTRLLAALPHGEAHSIAAATMKAPIAAASSYARVRSWVLPVRVEPTDVIGTVEHGIVALAVQVRYAYRNAEHV